MLHGSIDPPGRPKVALSVRGPYGTTRLDAIIDTGFTGTLVVPADGIRRLGLLKHSFRFSEFGDGRREVTPTFWGEVEWMGQWISIEILSGALDEALVGAGLLRGHVLVVDYGAAWSVEIR